MVCVADKSAIGQVADRLRGVGRYHASRTVLCAVEPREGLLRPHELLESVYVVDLAWLRSTPWRERVAATFDPPALRPELRTISAVTVRHNPDSTAAALLLIGWLASRLSWDVGQ